MRCGCGEHLGRPKRAGDDSTDQDPDLTEALMCLCMLIVIHKLSRAVRYTIRALFGGVGRGRAERPDLIPG
jgi:hypothetical protein